MSSRLGSLFSPKATAIYGIVGPLFAFICIVIAISVSPWFVWTNNALSDLGHPSLYPTSPQSSMYFNSGLIIAGIVVEFFTLGLGSAMGFGVHPEKKVGAGAGFGLKTKQKIAASLAVALLFVAGMALVGIGLFPENMPPWHYLFSVTLFVSAGLSLLFFGVAFMLKSQTRMLGAVSFISGIAHTFFWVTYWVVNPWPGVAIPEAASNLIAYAWILLMCVVVTTGKGIKPKK